MDQYNEDDGGIRGAFESSPFTGGSVYGSLFGVKSGMNAALEAAVLLVLIIVLIVLATGTVLPTWGWLILVLLPVAIYLGREAYQYFDSKNLSATTTYSP